MFNTRIPLYGIMFSLSFIVNIIVVSIIYKKFNFTKDEIIGAIIYENIGIVVGAKLLTYITSYNWKGNFMLMGYSSYGGLIGAIVCLIIFGIQFKKSVKDMLFTFMPPIPLMYSVGKIGCFLEGCCYGINYNGPCNVVYYYSSVAPKGVPLFPVQIVETIVFFLIFICTFILIKKEKFNWNTLGFMFVLIGFAKFALDYLRMSHVGQIFSTNQIISIFFIVIGLIINIVFYRKNKKVTT